MCERVRVERDTARRSPARRHTHPALLATQWSERSDSNTNFSAKLPGKSPSVHALKPLMFFPWKHSRSIANQGFRILIQMYFWGKFAAAVGSGLGCSGDPRLRAVLFLTRLAHPLLLCLCGSSVKTLAGASDLIGQEKDRAGSFHPLQPKAFPFLHFSILH